MNFSWWLNLFQTGFPAFLQQSSSGSVSGVQSSLGNKRKWVSLPLEEVSRDDGDKTLGGGPAHTDADPTCDLPDTTSPNHTLHNNRAHDSSRSKWPAARCFLFTPSVSVLLLHSHGLLSTPLISLHVCSPLSICLPRVCKLVLYYY